MINTTVVLTAACMSPAEYRRKVRLKYVPAPGDELEVPVGRKITLLLEVQKVRFMRKGVPFVFCTFSKDDDTDVLELGDKLEKDTHWELWE